MIWTFSELLNYQSRGLETSWDYYSFLNFELSSTLFMWPPQIGPGDMTISRWISRGGISPQWIKHTWDIMDYTVHESYVHFGKYCNYVHDHAYIKNHENGMGVVKWLHCERKIFLPLRTRYIRYTNIYIHIIWTLLILEQCFMTLPLSHASKQPGRPKFALGK